MNQKLTLSLALVAGVVAAGTSLGLGVGRPPRPVHPGVAAVREEARFPGRKLFTDHQCVVCHGPDGSGTEMGPGLGAIMPEYLAASGGDETLAKQRIVRYLEAPQGVPTLRRDSTRYPNPMPSAQGLGLDDEKLARLAEYLLHLRPPAKAVGGDAQGR